MDFYFLERKYGCTFKRYESIAVMSEQNLIGHGNMKLTLISLNKPTNITPLGGYFQYQNEDIGAGLIIFLSNA